MSILQILYEYFHSTKVYIIQNAAWIQRRPMSSHAINNPH